MNNNSGQDPTVNDAREVGTKESESLSKMPKQTYPDSNVGNVASMGDLSQVHRINTLLQVDQSSTNGPHENETRILSDEMVKETHQVGVSGFENETEPTVYDPEENQSISPGEGKAVVDQVNGGTWESTPLSTSLQEETYSSGSIEKRQEEKMTVSSDPVQFFSESGANGEKDTPSTPYEVNTSDASASFDMVLDKQLESLSLDEPDDATEENEHEDINRFLSELHQKEDVFPSDFGQSMGSNQNLDNFSPVIKPELFDMEKSAYEPSPWTPMELEIATGNPDCTHLEHPLKLRSTYTEVEVNHMVFILCVFLLSL